MSLYVNSLLDYRDDEAKLTDCERVLWIDRDKDVVVTISILNKKGVPKLKCFSSLELDIKNGTVSKREYDPYTTFMVPEEKLTIKEIQIRDHAWELIREMVEIEP